MGINVTRPYIDMVRQPTDETCFAACISTLTGIPLDALPMAPEAALDTLNLGPESGMFIATDLAREGLGLDVTTIEDWQRGIDNVAILEGWTHWDEALGRGILCLAMWKAHDDADGHAVVIDEKGYMHDPGAGSFEGLHIMTLTRACNVSVSGFVSVTEVDHDC